MRLQQSKIDRLNAKYNVDMSSTRLRGGKAFAAEQKIREFKKLLLKSKGIEKRLKVRLNPNNLITKATNNLIYAKSAKYDIASETVEKETIKNPLFIEVYDFHRLNKVKENLGRREKSDINSDNRKKIN